MYAHGMAGTGLITFEQKLQNKPVIRHRNLAHIFAIMGYL
jgi:hypothetical protein